MREQAIRIKEENDYIKRVVCVFRENQKAYTPTLGRVIVKPILAEQ